MYSSVGISPLITPDCTQQEGDLEGRDPIIVQPGRARKRVSSSAPVGISLGNCWLAVRRGLGGGDKEGACVEGGEDGLPWHQPQAFRCPVGHGVAISARPAGTMGFASEARRPGPNSGWIIANLWGLSCPALKEGSARHSSGREG